MFSYWDVTIKLALGLLTIILQINLSGKSNLAPISASTKFKTTFSVQSLGA